MKKFAFFVAVALCLTLCLMIPASAEESAEEPALESEGFRWRLLEDGTAEILKYTGEELRLILPETLDGRPVTSIGEEAFYNYKYDMSGITIPASVTHIGSGAFSLTDLKEIKIPAGVVSMGDNPFGYCISLETITVAEGNPAFYVQDGVLFCSEDRSLVCFPNMLADPEDEEEHTYTVPAGTEIIRGDAFGGVEGLSEIFLPDSLRAIGSQAFGFCFGRAVLPAGLKQIPSMLFYECEELSAVDIPATVTVIGGGAFTFCGLEEVRIPDGVTEIGASAFEGCWSLRSVVIPDSVKAIGESAFNSCAEDLVILCGPDSFAQTYCEQNSLAFRNLVSGRNDGNL